MTIITAALAATAAAAAVEMGADLVLCYHFGNSFFKLQS
jgi:hypothetical protein